MVSVRRIAVGGGWTLFLSVLLFSLGLSGQASAQICGDVDSSGSSPDITDLSLMRTYLLDNGEAPSPLWVGDMDGVEGITAGDFWTLYDNQFGLLTPLDCSIETYWYDQSNDWVTIRNTAVPPGESATVVDIWFDADDAYWDITFPFSFDCATSPVLLDSVVRADGHLMPIDTLAQQGIVMPNLSGSHGAGDRLLAQLYFSVTPQTYPQEIVIDTSWFPPSHTTVISRNGTGGRAIEGFVPYHIDVILPECGDLDGTGSVDVDDISLLLHYLYFERSPFPSPLWVADMDGVPGITHNDFLTLTDNQFISLTPLDCSTTPDSSFQISDDSVFVLNTVVPPGLTDWIVEVRLDAISGHGGLTLPFVFDCSTSSVTLDSITDHGSAVVSIDTAGQRGFVGPVTETGFPGGNALIGRLWFSVDLQPYPQEIVIDTGVYPPSHPLMLSRGGAGDRVYDGFTPAFVVVPGEEGCLADGDVNNSGFLDVADAAALTNFIYLGGPAPDPLYKADVTGDGVIDSLDVATLACALFGGCPPPSLPVATRCYPRVFKPGDTALALGGGYLTQEGDTIVVNPNPGDSTAGVRIYGDESQSGGIRVGLTNADMSIADVGLEFTVAGYVEGTEKMPQGTMQVMASVGIFNSGSGSLQVFGDYSPVGDPNVLVEVYYSGVGMTGSASVPGGGLIAFGNEYNGGGLPSVLLASFQTAAPPTFAAKLSAVTEFTLVGGPVLLGDSIRLVGANAGTISSCAMFDMNGINMAFLGLVNIKTNACCRGLTGNVDCDNFDVIDITDVSVLVDNQFLSLTPLCCPREANFNYPGSGHTTTDNVVDITDLSIMIDNQFLTLTPLPDCP